MVFHAVNGTTMRVTMRQGRLFMYPRVGSQVKVFYDPAKPDVAYIDSAGFRHGSSVFVVVCLGLAVLYALQL